MMEVKYMLWKNSCYTYFRIIGKFKTEEITKKLGLKPCKTLKYVDKLNNTTNKSLTIWDYGVCRKYDVDVTEQMEKTIELLKDKTEILNQIRQEYKCVMVLEIISTVYVNEIVPNFSPSIAVVKFCHDTRTRINMKMVVKEKHVIVAFLKKLVNKKT